MPTEHSLPEWPPRSPICQWSSLCCRAQGWQGLKAGQLGSVCVPLPLSVLAWQHIYFSLSPQKLGRRRQAKWQEQEMMDMKMSCFFFFLLLPFTEWTEENVVSYLVRAWLTANRGLMAKSAQSPFCFSLECEKKRLFNYHIFAYI